MHRKIEYIKCGGSYQLTRTFQVQTSFRPKANIITARITMMISGLMTLYDGYCWDGTSGPVIDRKTNMRGGCVHDGCYELMRRGHLPYQDWRAADAEFAKLLKADGAWDITIKIDMLGLKLANGKYAHPSQRKRRFTAP